MASCGASDRAIKSRSSIANLVKGYVTKRDPEVVKITRSHVKIKSKLTNFMI